MLNPIAYIKRHRARKAARQAYRAILNRHWQAMRTSDYLNRKCADCGLTITPSGYCYGCK